jgi:repressor LexA
MEFNEKLKSLRHALGLTLEDVAKVVGVSKPTVQRWENGNIKNLRMDKIKKLADVLLCTPDYLMGWEEGAGIAEKKTRIPVFDRILAGTPVEVMGNILSYEEISTEEAKAGDYFGLLVTEDNMEPRIQKDDIVIVRGQSDLESGQIGVILVGEQDARLYFIKKENGGLWLVSSNVSHADVFYSREDIRQKPVRIIGRAVELRGKL